eukprot:8020639-Alexandrium_andersonii.AAC.1
MPKKTSRRGWDAGSGGAPTTSTRAAAGVRTRSISAALSAAAEHASRLPAEPASANVLGGKSRRRAAR